MGTQPSDSSPDPFLSFASETPVTSTIEREPAPPTIERDPATLTIEREPAFLLIPATSDVPSVTSVVEQAPAARVGVRLVATVSVVIGLLAGFAAGYGLAYRIIAAAPPSTLVIAGPANPPAPRTTPATEPRSEASVPAPATQPPREARVQTPATHPAREASVPGPAQRTDTRATAVAPARSSTRQASLVAPVRPAPVATTGRPGAIEVQSRPRGAQVLLDGNVVGRAPMSIPDVSEGMHEVRVELEGFSPWVGSVQVKDGSRVRVGASLER
jgi:hypothetical protein